MKLYEIDAAIDECIDMETGEILDEERLEALEMERSKKIEGALLAAKNHRAQAAAIREAIKGMTERARRAETIADGYEAWVKRTLAGSKFETPYVQVTYRPSQAVIVDDIDKLPMEFVRTKYEADKTSLKKALKDGEVPGAHLEDRVNMVIK